jgi:hypothetical protein
MHKLVVFEVGNTTGFSPAGTHRFPVLRSKVTDINAPVDAAEDTIDLVAPDVDTIVQIRDTLSEYLKVMGRE